MSVWSYPKSMEAVEPSLLLSSSYSFHIYIAISSSLTYCEEATQRVGRTLLSNLLFLPLHKMQSIKSASFLPTKCNLKALCAIYQHLAPPQSTFVNCSQHLKAILSESWLQTGLVQFYNVDLQSIFRFDNFVAYAQHQSTFITESFSESSELFSV